MINNTVVPSSKNEEIYHYINKNKDLRLLDLQKQKENISTSESINNNLYVSYTTNKIAKLGFIFDLEDFLTKKSKSFNFLKSAQIYRETILNNSLIKQDTIEFFKRKISYDIQDFAKITSTPILIKMQDSIDDNKYLFTTSDDNKDLNNKEKYSVKVKFNIINGASAFLSSDVLLKLGQTKDFMIRYKEIFEMAYQDKSIKNKKKYLFENVYENYLNDIKESISSLSHLFSFYNNINIDRYYSLFTSIFHPLSSTIELLSLVIEKITLLEQTLIEYAYDDQATISYEHEFKYIDIDERAEYQLIDYNYDAFYGYEVISTDTADIRYTENIAGMKILTSAEKNARKIYESSKYFGLSSEDVYKKINHLSITYLDAGEDKYNLLNSISEQTSVDYNNLFIRLNELNNFNFKYNNLESYYFQLMGKNLYIKNIAQRNNDSKNDLQPATLFDPNLDSKQKSLKYITDTGVSILYYLLDDNHYIDVPINIFQYQSTLSTGSSYQGIYPVTEELKNNPEAKPSLICFYNNFFEDKLIFAGQNYEVWKIEAALVNDIFNKKLKLFNEYYILEKKKTKELAQPQNIEYPFENELKMNIPTKYLNRNVNTYKVIISTEEM